MSAWLGGWLKDIILVVLLASFIDLLLPNSSIQRYVKVVISLFIITTILSPLVGALFKIDLEKSVSTAFARLGDGNSAAIEPLSQILADGEKMRTENDDRSSALVERQLSAMVEQQISERFSKTADVQVSIAQDQGKSPQIQEMDVTLLPDSDAPSAPDGEKPPGENSENSGSVRIEPVRPVQIEIDLNGRKNESVPASADAGGQDEASDSVRSIRDYLQKQWHLSSGHIHIYAARASG